ncbi:hypothetical protein Hanom_Chr14g01260251 [Helianthus anomalus]
MKQQCHHPPSVQEIYKLALHSSIQESNMAFNEHKKVVTYPGRKVNSDTTRYSHFLFNASRFRSNPRTHLAKPVMFGLTVYFLILISKS